MKVFALTLAAGVHAGLISSHEKLNANYDNLDPNHNFFGGDFPASPAYPNVPDLSQAVGHFDPDGTLFGEHRYQLQVAKTGNMLIGTEALRESIAQIRNRISAQRARLTENNNALQYMSAGNNEVQQLINENSIDLNDLSKELSDIEKGFGALHSRLCLDREVLIMMCHQYAYAQTIPEECEPFLGGLHAPLNFAWNFPTKDCPPEAPLPPFNHQLNL